MNLERLAFHFYNFHVLFSEYGLIDADGDDPMAQEFLFWIAYHAIADGRDGAMMPALDFAMDTILCYTDESKDFSFKAIDERLKARMKDEQIAEGDQVQTARVAAAARLTVDNGELTGHMKREVMASSLKAIGALANNRKVDWPIMLARAIIDHCKDLGRKDLIERYVRPIEVELQKDRNRQATVRRMREEATK